MGYGEGRADRDRAGTALDGLVIPRQHPGAIGGLLLRPAFAPAQLGETPPKVIEDAFEGLSHGRDDRDSDGGPYT